MVGDQMDLVYRVLDDQLVDVNGRRCGRVDDLEFEGGPGEPAYLTSILAGKGAWWRRLPRRLRPLGRRVLGEGVIGEDVIRVPWREVEDVTAVVRLRAQARDLGLGRGDDEMAGLIGKLPNA